MNLAAWYSDPENELFRREISWARRWLFMGRGRKWLFLFVLVSFTGLLGWIIQFGMWFHLLQSRTFEFFRKERLQDVLMTRLDGRNLWPALIAAPVFVTLVLGIVSSVARFAFMMALQRINLGSLEFPASGTSGRFAPPQVSVNLMMTQVIATGLTGLLQWVAVTAYVARSVLPRGGGISLVVGFIVGWVLMKLPEFALYIFLAWRSFGSSSGSSFGIQITEPIAVWGPLALGTLMAGVLYTFSIRSLRGASFRRQLERLAQAGS